MCDEDTHRRGTIVQVFCCPQDDNFAGILKGAVVQQQFSNVLSVCMAALERRRSANVTLSAVEKCAGFLMEHKASHRGLSAANLKPSRAAFEAMIAGLCSESARAGDFRAVRDLH